MTSPADAIAHALSNSKMMLHRLTDDLKPEEYLHRPADKANCVAWLLGHLALSDRRMLSVLGAGDLPVLPDGFEKQFSREQGCPEAQTFGDVSRLLPIFDQHRDRLIAAAKSASAQQLEKPTERVTPMFQNVGEAINFMAIHTAMHTGQISMIRRTLGRPPVI